MSLKPINIVFAVCHPDDEAIWCGGLLYELSRFDHIKAHVICLSGKDAASVRENEFDAAKEIAQYESGIVLGYPLRKALEPLPNSMDTLEEGMRLLKIEVESVDLLVTHSPYGDEHLHPHHCQVHGELKKWAARRNVPFAFFSCLPIPHLWMKPIQTRTRRRDTFQITQVCRSFFRPPLLYLLFGWSTWVMKTRPSYFIQFLTDYRKKRAMLECYPSVNSAEFEKGYASFSHSIESLYINDKQGYSVFANLMELMEVEGSPTLFMSPPLLRRILNRLNRVFS